MKISEIEDDLNNEKIYNKKRLEDFDEDYFDGGDDDEDEICEHCGYPLDECKCGEDQTIEDE